MLAHKCDFCNEEIKKPIAIRMGLEWDFELCNFCATPILDYLKECEVIDENNKEIKEELNI